MAPNDRSVVVWYESDFHFDIAIWAVFGWAKLLLPGGRGYRTKAKFGRSLSLPLFLID